MGNTEHWLMKAKGPKGDKGDPGQDGVDGLTPNIAPIIAQATNAQSMARNAQGMSSNVQSQINDLPDFTVIFENQLM